MVEKMLFNVIAIALFVIVFCIMAKRNDTNYIILLVVEAIGICINFLELNFNLFQNITFKIIEYVLAIIIPLAIIIMERKKIKFPEILAIAQVFYYQKINQHDKSKAVLLSLVEKYPDSYIGHKQLAEVCEKAGEIETAIYEYYQLVEINEDKHTNIIKVAELFNKINQSDQAEMILNDLLEIKPDCYDATMLLGDILYNGQRFKEAIGVYSNALRYRPEDYNLYYCLGMVYVGLNDFPNAKTCYEKAAQINSKLYNAYYSLGQIALISNEIDEAEKYFTESLYDNDLEAESYFELAKIYMLKNDKEKAIIFIQKAIELDSDYVSISKKEPIFIPIKQYLVENTTAEKTVRKEKKDLTLMESYARKNLTNTAKLVDKLGYRQREEKIKKENQKELDGNNDNTRSI